MDYFGLPYAATASAACILVSTFGVSECLRCKATSQRTRFTPEGDTSRKFVQDGNFLAARCSLLCWLASSMGIIWTMEQPHGSLLMFTRRMQQMLQHVTVSCYEMSCMWPVHVLSYVCLARCIVLAFGWQPLRAPIASGISSSATTGHWWMGSMFLVATSRGRRGHRVSW